LLFGTKPKLPIDHVFNWSEDAQGKPAQEYVMDIQEQIVKTQNKLIQKQLDKSKDKQKSYYDRRTKPVRLEVGNQVLVKKLAFEGRHKIEDKYEPDTYIILEQPRPDIPVFKIRSLSKDEKIRTLHRNHLLLLPTQEKVEDDKEDASGHSGSQTSEAVDKTDHIRDAQDVKAAEEEIEENWELVEVRSSNDSFISDTPESRQQRQAEVELDCDDDEEEDGPDEDGEEDLRAIEDEEYVVEDLVPVEDEAIVGDHRDEQVEAPDDATEEDSPEDVAAEEVHATEEPEDPVEETSPTHEDAPATEADDVSEEPDPPVPAPRPN